MTTPANRRHVLGLIATAPLGVAAASQTAKAADLAAAPAALSDEERRRLTDFPWLGRYAADNARVIASGTRVNLVFMGDSITQGWPDKRPAFFAQGSRVGRGIGGQTTPQMVLRMMADVIALRPRAVHIMAGTNDIAGNTGPMTAQQTHDNLAAMATLAQANGIAVLLGSVPPAANYPWRPGLDTVTPIAAVNQWLAAYAAQHGHTFVDYHTALQDGTGGMRPGLAYDGVHPTEAGYATMEQVLEPILAAKSLS
ncbi:MULTISPECIES: GDSL-type esterase/lipase family protein [unclassified Sphingomonas]|uniref:GDSL-type esterase/lipase family protein n=1 Tax=Novosphingobium rhizosphaerae TaxID=1551649 RepID=UPI0015CEA234